MLERKIVKLKVNMYEDTKFKIIDTKPERDLIHYVWTRLITLAGKVNLEGDLFMSKNLKYTIETLAIEFNRDFSQIKLALDVFIELEMIELSETNVYRVINFAKHQNIKVEEKIKPIEETVKVKEIAVKEVLKNEIYDIEDIEIENKISPNEAQVIKVDDKDNLEVKSSSINKVDNTSENKTNIKVQDTNSLLPQAKKNKTINKKKKKEAILNMNEEAGAEEVGINNVFEGERPLGKGEKVIAQWFF